MDWDRIRVFLAVARSGQLIGAARALGVNHATVSRQLTALETDMKTQLVVRRMGGCVLTPAGETLLLAAERAESAFLQAEGALAGAAALTGNVRVGAPEGLGNYFLAGSLAQFAAAHPGLTVQLVPLPRSFSLTRREADIALSLDEPRQPSLVAQKLTDYSVGLYAARSYLDRHPPIESEDDLTAHPLITFVEDLLHTPALDYARRISANIPQRFECGSVVAQVEAARAGGGVAILHDFVAETFPELKRVVPSFQCIRSYWLVSHPDTMNIYRVAEVRRHIAESVRAARKRFVTPAG